jgi:hypothetical protein
MLVFLLSIITVECHAQDLHLFENIDKEADSISRSATDLKHTIVNDTLAASNFKEEFFVDRNDPHLKRIIDTEGNFGKGLLLISKYYFINHTLIKVEQRIITPSNEVIRQSDWYYSDNKPIFRNAIVKKKDKKEAFRMSMNYLYRAKALIEDF